MKQEFLLSGLDCPHCAGKIETEVRALPDVQKADVNLMKQTLTVLSDVDLLAQVENIVHSHEPHVMVCRRGVKRAVEAASFKGQLTRLGIGGLIFIAGLVLSRFFDLWVTLPVLVLAYGVLGYDVVFKALKNILRGRVFDENFLMSLSTIGAFVIGEYPEAVAVMLFYQVGELFQSMAVHRSRRSISQLMDIRPDTATVMRKGAAVTVSPDDVAVGERILVKPGERIPLDGVVLEGQSLVDTGALTGESLPREVMPGDEVLSGCINQSGALTVRVSKVYGDSTVAKIIDLVENAASKKAPAENFITTFARYYTPVVVVLAALLATVPPLLLSGGWAQWIHRGFVFLVVSCPCALVISIPLTFFGGIGAASRHGVLVKGSNYLDALNKLHTVVFDKTGTLTKGTFRVTKILPAPGFTEAQVLSFAAQGECLSTHPIAASIMVAYQGNVDSSAISDYTQISGYGVQVCAEGKLLLCGNHRLLAERGIAAPPCEDVGTKIYVAVDGVYAGCILISDELKADSKAAVAALKHMGVEKVVMLTGDEAPIAETVAQELGLDEYHARLLPQDKVTRLEQLQNQKPSGTTIAFVGDGINDAPVLARADIGIAMGGLGSDAAIEAADVVIMTDEPSRLADALQIAKATRRIVVQNIVFALGIKGLFLLLGALGIAGMWEAVFADVGVAVLAILNAMRMLRK